MVLGIFWTIEFPPRSSAESPGPPRRGFQFGGGASPRVRSPDNTTRCMSRSRVGGREARADGERGKLIECIAARASVSQLHLVKLLGHARVPFAGDCPDHRVRIKFAAIDAHRAAEAAANIERRLSDGVARQARQNRLEIGDPARRAAAGQSGPPRSVKWGREIVYSMPTNGPACLHIARCNAGKLGKRV